MRTRIESASSALPDAVALLGSGDLVAFPTETVYGLGADARSDSAVQKIYAAKGRPSGNPIIVHVASTEAARQCAAVGGWNDRAEALAKRFWPGPLTIIVPRGLGISTLVSAGYLSVALRCPNHPVANALLRAFDGPIAAPSANRSGFTSPTSAPHVLAELDGRVPLILDGGECAVGIESTVIDVSRSTSRILRPGAVTLEMLSNVIGPVEVAKTVVREEDAAASPGQHARHYAPRTPAFRFTAPQWPRVLSAIREPVALLTWSDTIHLPEPHESFRLPQIAADFARVMYAALRDADDKQLSAIYVLMPADDAGLWVAIADRLTRATQPFSDH